MDKLLMGVISIPIVGAVIHFIITTILAILLAMTYNSLTKEELIATIVFDKENNQSQKYIDEENNKKHKAY